MVPMAARQRPESFEMTLKEKLAKAKLINKYTVERDNYKNALLRTVNPIYVSFLSSKAREYQAKIDALNEPKEPLV